jgi:hypothetical protein
VNKTEKAIVYKTKNSSKEPLTIDHNDDYKNLKNVNLDGPAKPVKTEAAIDTGVSTWCHYFL